MEQVRFGIIGMGNMGSGHAASLMAGKIKGVALAAVCEASEARRQSIRETWPELAVFETSRQLFESGLVDAVLIATPHFDHPTNAIAAFDHGLHVLIEKPAGVSVARVRPMNEAAAASGKTFGIMYNQRMNPLYAKVRDLVVSGELGEIRRTNWIITNWYRPQAYYDSGTWRATWAGEGGGVLLNQCPHQLDLWQWTTGLMPARVRAFCHFGKYRNIEVEDEVTAYVEYANGATGVFITTTGETPGTNRYEVIGDRGKLVIEDGKLHYWRLRESEPEFNARNTVSFAAPEVWRVDVGDFGPSPEHVGLMQNFADAILRGTPLVAPGEEGMLGLSISNAMHLSSWQDRWVELPLDENEFERQLQARIDNSVYKRDGVAAGK
ncbi:MULTISPECIES: Gfo/Idh/MocA family protein [Cohnella]|uniref:Gfo/Idh/MocA family protein n=1 Tax=Cohnella TaxID=329857 RepID=UPI0009BB07EB|nr:MULTISPECIES: Gfo/Idh/MocA family oxidoreductase [Cohnella]MBN2980203.1 Gfo/Idh/MocA family oxidoreductase [Cohnella algarum]